MIKAVVFDCFGVLTSDGWLPFKRKHFGHDTELDRQATDLSKQLNAGFISFDEFLTQIAELAGVPKGDAYTLIRSNVADEELFEYIRTVLKPKYKLGVLSNAGANWMNDLFTPEDVALFDVICLSCETGHLKPDQRAYLDAAQRMGVKPEEVVFVDDQERYATAARDAGMEAVWYQEFDQFKKEFETLAA
jgi:putative hydrolase of the HAD superfamily